VVERLVAVVGSIADAVVGVGSMHLGEVEEGKSEVGHSCLLGLHHKAADQEMKLGRMEEDHLWVCHMKRPLGLGFDGCLDNPTWLLV